MESPAFACTNSMNDDEDNDSDLMRLLINERKSTMSQENIKILERSECLKREYHTLETVNPLCIIDENIATKAPVTEFISVGEPNNRGTYLTYPERTMSEFFDEDLELHLSDFSDVMTSFTADEKKNRKIIELSKQIENNISECRTLAFEAKTILAEKMTMQRELNVLNEQIAYCTLEDARQRKVQRRRGTECAQTLCHRRTYFCRFGIPYFKTKDRFPADQNEDLKEVIRNNEIMVIRMPTIRRILPQDTRSLDMSILNQLKMKRVQQLQLRLQKLVKPQDGNEEFEQQALNLKKAIESARTVNNIGDTVEWNIPVDFCALPKLNPRFSVEDYERMWKLLGDPKLSREDFSDEELDRMKILAQNFGNQDWDSIAEKLNTNRSAFVCFNKWISLSRKGSREPWTKEEDDLLMKLCGKLDRMKDNADLHYWWRHIRRQFPHRTYSQIHGHWTYKLSPSLKKGRFTEGETEKLELLIREGKTFGEIASIFQTRSSVQLRSHYNQIVGRASHNSGTWTEEEEVTLFKLIEKHGTNNWVKISKELGTRNRSQCRLKYLQGAWNPDETRMLLNLVEKYGTNFEKISQELGTKSAGQCRLKYVRHKEAESEGACNEGRWNRKENKLFRMLIAKYKDDFTLISQELKTRTVEQCHEKYERMMQHPIKKIEVKILDGHQEDRILKIYQNDTKLSKMSRTSRWTLSERAQFKKLLREHGCQFHLISKGLSTKSIMQCRNMYKRMSQEGKLYESDINETDLREKSAPVVVETDDGEPFYEADGDEIVEDPLKDDTAGVTAGVMNEKDKSVADVSCRTTAMLAIVDEANGNQVAQNGRILSGESITTLERAENLKDPLEDNIVKEVSAKVINENNRNEAEEFRRTKRKKLSTNEQKPVPNGRSVSRSCKSIYKRKTMEQDPLEDDTAEKVPVKEIRKNARITGKVE